MGFQVKLSPAVRPYLSSLSQLERDRLFRCWDLLAVDPNVDRISKVLHSSSAVGWAASALR